MKVNAGKGIRFQNLPASQDSIQESLLEPKTGSKFALTRFLSQSLSQSVPETDQTYVINLELV
jgi:hypothetical protein